MWQVLIDKFSISFSQVVKLNSKSNFEVVLKQFQVFAQLLCRSCFQSEFSTLCDIDWVFCHEVSREDLREFRHSKTSLLSANCMHFVSTKASKSSSTLTKSARLKGMKFQMELYMQCEESYIECMSLNCFSSEIQLVII